MQEAPRNEVDAVFGTRPTKPPTPEQQSLGAVISIFVIMGMIVMGAYYSYTKRAALSPAPVGTATTTDSTPL